MEEHTKKTKHKKTTGKEDLNLNVGSTMQEPTDVQFASTLQWKLGACTKSSSTNPHPGAARNWVWLAKATFIKPVNTRTHLALLENRVYLKHWWLTACFVQIIVWTNPNHIYPHNARLYPHNMICFKTIFGHQIHTGTPLEKSGGLVVDTIFRARHW